MKFSFFGKEVTLKKEVIFGVVASLIILVGTYMFLYTKGDGDIIVDRSKEVVSTTPQAMKKEQAVGVQKEENKEDIKIYVVGEVKTPGIVVTLKKGQIIQDAIEKSGGLTENADKTKINLAYELTENTMIKVYSKKEIENAQASGGGNSGVEIIKDSSGAIQSDPQDTSANGKNSKININKATMEQLDSLPGVGPAMAKKIIDYRTKSGNFKVKEDLKKVSGIGESKYNNLKDLILVN